MIEGGEANQYSLVFQPVRNKLLKLLNNNNNPKFVHRPNYSQGHGSIGLIRARAMVR